MNVDLGQAAKDTGPAVKDTSGSMRTDSLVALAMKKTTASTGRDTKRTRAKSEPLIEASLTGAQFDVRFTVRRSDAMQCAQWLSERAVVARRKRTARSDATSVRINKATKGGAQ